MDVRYLGRVIKRHWVVVASVIMMSIVVAAVLVRRIEPAFEASGSMLILGPSPKAPVGEEFNPLQNAGQVSLSSTALIERMQSEAIVERLRAQGLGNPYSLMLPPGGSGAVMTLHTESESSVGALTQYQRLAQAVQDEMRGIQQRAGVDQSVQVEARELSTPIQASSLSGSKVRVLGGVLFLGAASSFALASMVDALYGDNRRPFRRPFHRGTPVRDGGEATAGNRPRPASKSNEDDEGDNNNNLDLILSIFSNDQG